MVSMWSKSAYASGGTPGGRVWLSSLILARTATRQRRDAPRPGGSSEPDSLVVVILQLLRREISNAQYMTMPSDCKRSCRDFERTVRVARGATSSPSACLGGHV